MDLGWSQDQLSFRDSVSKFARTIAQEVSEHEQKDEFPHEDWKRCAQFGIQGMAVPREFGGHEIADILTGVLAMEAMGEACPDLGLLFALSTHTWTVQDPILRFGTPAQKQKYLPGMCKGTIIGAHAMTEPNAGSDVFSLETTATACDGGFELNGRKHLITLAPIANLALVFATTDKTKGKWGITAFLVNCDSRGLDRSAHCQKMGLRTAPMGELIFEDCFVPIESVLGSVGSGFAVSQSALTTERCCLLASHVGQMQRQLNHTVEFAKNREQSGQAIGKFQAISHRLVDMKLRLETARLLLYQVAWLKANGKEPVQEAAMLKLHLSEAFVESSLDAMRIRGGHAYLTETGIERQLRDAVGGLFYAGTSEIQRNIIASCMGL